MRPQIRVGDKVRLRTDGDIGIYNKECNFAIDKIFTVTGIANDKMISGIDKDKNYYSFHKIQLEICNDFNEVEVGDEIEFALKNGSTIIHTILKINNVSIVTNHGQYWIENIKEYFLRITKKAEKPQPKFAGIKVGDWVKIINREKSYIVIKVTNEWFMLGGFGCDTNARYDFNGMNLYKYFADMEVVKILKPSEVVLDFGNGIKGKIEDIGNNIDVLVRDDSGEIVAILQLKYLTEPMKSIVLDLIKRQEEEK